MYGMPWNELGKIISLWNFALDVFISCKKNCSSLLYIYSLRKFEKYFTRSSCSDFCDRKVVRRGVGDEFGLLQLCGSPLPRLRSSSRIHLIQTHSSEIENIASFRVEH